MKILVRDLASLNVVAPRIERSHGREMHFRGVRLWPARWAAIGILTLRKEDRR